MNRSTLANCTNGVAALLSVISMFCFFYYPVIEHRLMGQPMLSVRGYELVIGYEAVPGIPIAGNPLLIIGFLSGVAPLIALIVGDRKSRWQGIARMSTLVLLIVYLSFIAFASVMIRERTMGLATIELSPYLYWQAWASLILFVVGVSNLFIMEYWSNSDA